MKPGKNLYLSNETKSNYNNQIYKCQNGLAHVKVEGLKQNLLCGVIDVENECTAETTLRRDEREICQKGSCISKCSVADIRVTCQAGFLGALQKF